MLDVGERGMLMLAGVSDRHLVSYIAQVPHGGRTNEPRAPEEHRPHQSWAVLTSGSSRHGRRVRSEPEALGGDDREHSGLGLLGDLRQNVRGADQDARRGL